MEVKDVLNDPNSYYIVSSFCHQRGITIHPLVIRRNVLKIIINNNGNQTLGKDIYTNETVDDKMKELYTLIYNKLNKKK